MINKKTQGKKNRQAGARFERKVRKDLESEGFVVDRWTNQVSDYPENNINKPPKEREDRKLIPARSNRFNMRTTGFPDFICFHRIEVEGVNRTKFPKKIAIRNSILGKVDLIIPQPLFSIIGIEVKSNGYLNKKEKEKAHWLLENNIFSRIIIAKKSKQRGKIEYIEF